MSLPGFRRFHLADIFHLEIALGNVYLLYVMLYYLLVRKCNNYHLSSKGRVRTRSPDLVTVLSYYIDRSAVDLFLEATCVQGPVVQSIVSLTSSLRGQLVKCFTTL